MPGQPGLKGNLVDREGFPRADVDIHNVRILRNRLAYSRNPNLCLLVYLVIYDSG